MWHEVCDVFNENPKTTIDMEHQEITNEMWLDTLTTINKAIWLSKAAENFGNNYWKWKNWLKEKHKRINLNE